MKRALQRWRDVEPRVLHGGFIWFIAVFTLIEAFLGLAAFSELLERAFMTTVAWYVIAAILAAFEVAFMSYMLWGDASQLDIGYHQWYLFKTRRVLMAIGAVLVFVLLLAFDRRHRDQIAAFDDMRYDRGDTTVGPRLLATWSGIMAVVVVRFLLRLEDFFVSWAIVRHPLVLEWGQTQKMPIVDSMGN